jgi:hypothetical protein
MLDFLQPQGSANVPCPACRMAMSDRPNLVAPGRTLECIPCGLAFRVPAARPAPTQEAAHGEHRH